MEASEPPNAGWRSSVRLFCPNPHRVRLSTSTSAGSAVDGSPNTPPHAPNLDSQSDAETVTRPQRPTPHRTPLPAKLGDESSDDEKSSEERTIAEQKSNKRSRGPGKNTRRKKAKLVQHTRPRTGARSKSPFPPRPVKPVLPEFTARIPKLNVQGLEFVKPPPNHVVSLLPAPSLQDTEGSGVTLGGQVRQNSHAMAGGGCAWKRSAQGNKTLVRGRRHR